MAEKIFLIVMLLSLGALLLATVFYIGIQQDKRLRPYYVISLKWSTDAHLAFLRKPGDNGITHAIEYAGVFTRKMIDQNPGLYNDGVENLAIECDRLDHYFKALTRYEINNGSIRKLQNIIYQNKRKAEEKINDARFEIRKAQLIAMGFRYNMRGFSLSGIWSCVWEQVYYPTDQEWAEYIIAIEDAISHHTV